MTTIAEVLQSAARKFGARPAICDRETTLSFEELERWATRVARALAARGVRRGDRVAIWAPNRWEWIAAALGTHLAGAALVPINTRFKGREAAYVLEKSGARILFTVGEFLGTDYVSALAPHRPAALDEIVRLEDWRPFFDAERDHDSPGDDDLSDVIFTSGTTGAPKGVMCTHAQTVRAFTAWSEIVGLREGDRYLVVLPFFHSFGYKAGWLASLISGATVFPQPVFDVEAVLERVEEERITVLPGPPSLYQQILVHPRRSEFDLSSLRLAVTGAAIIPVELIVRMREELEFETVLTGYGLTEATGVSTLCRQGDDPEIVARTSGRAIPGVQVKIAPDGEILVRGYTVSKGYFDDPLATRELIDEEGWLHTGDIGSLDEQGNLSITDRKKDMFIVGGFNAYPAEIEAVICEHPAVAQAAVVGAPDERLGEVGVAFVVKRPGIPLDPEGLISFCRQRMANYKVPRKIVTVDALPLNASGKVLKYVLREGLRPK
jgi:acyl-CoA synthetase (AMP-forming)/AMP-acid ligase II